MDTTLDVLAISGSLRKNSYNTAALRVAQEVAPPGMAIELYDLGQIPLYNGDVEALGDPEPIHDFKQRIRGADALLIATPEYNWSISGVLKNALDWASRPARAMPTSGKPAAILGAGGRTGTVRAQLHMRDIAVELNMHLLNKPNVYIARPWEKWDAQGRLLDDSVRTDIHGLLVALAAWTRQLRGEPETLEQRIVGA